MAAAAYSKPVAGVDRNRTGSVSGYGRQSALAVRSPGAEESGYGLRRPYVAGGAARRIGARDSRSRSTAGASAAVRSYDCPRPSRWAGGGGRCGAEGKLGTKSVGFALFRQFVNPCAARVFMITIRSTGETAFMFARAKLERGDRRIIPRPAGTPTPPGRGRGTRM